MNRTVWCMGGAVTAPHHLAAQSGVAVLRDGGSAVEAMVAAAATIAVVYPHMNSLGGDGVWLVRRPGEEPVAILACGRAGNRATPDLYRAHGLAAVPPRGALAALTVAGAVSGWAAALELAGAWRRATLPLARLTGDAVDYAENGVLVSAGMARDIRDKIAELRDVAGFAEAFLLPDGEEQDLPEEGFRLRQPRIAATLRHLTAAGLDDFYRGDLAAAIAGDLERVGAPLGADDLAAHRAISTQPLRLPLPGMTLFNTPPPTQGLASLLILGIFARLGVGEAEGFAHVHGLIEATKHAFRLRDRYVCDPDCLTIAPQALLGPDLLGREAAAIDRQHAATWPEPAAPGDTVWLGAIDREGIAVSYIQSIYWEFGSGVVLPETGILWQNRGASFSLDPAAVNTLQPGRLPFHTLNPALALLDDGRTTVYGTMGGDGQPQTQAALFTRYACFGQDLQEAIAAPRWLLGRTWGSTRTNLRLEGRFDPELVAALAAAGHDVEVVEPFAQIMGHAGAVVRHPDGRLAAATDPRSDGAAAGL